MLTLQGPFSYDGTSPPPVDQATIILGYPQWVPADNGVLKVSGQGSLVFKQNLADPKYYVQVPFSGLFGQDYGNVVMRYLQGIVAKKPFVNVSDVTIPFNYSFGSAATPAPFEAIYFFQGAQRAETKPPQPDVPRLAAATKAILTTSPRLKATQVEEDAAAAAKSAFPTTPLEPASVKLDVPERPAPEEPTRNDRLVDARVFVINKAIYATFQEKYFPGLAPESDGLSMYIIANLVDLTGPSPKLVQGGDGQSGRAIFLKLLKEFGRQDSRDDAAFAAITKDFDKFFEFPLKMPKLEALSIAGTIRIKTTETVTRADFSLYRLSANFSIVSASESDQLAQIISRYDWDPNAQPANNTLAFSFKDKNLINDIRSPVIISVTGYDNVELFTASYKASSPGLRAIKIEVDLRKPPVVTGGGPSDGGPTSGKRLRGKVVAVAKCCTLKGSVVLQAQASADSLWKAVSTGESDKEGNFSMPYPYGKYTDARALTSMDPTSYTYVSTNPESANESISTDFIYILLQKQKNGAKGKDDDECTCKAGTNAGRLPSQEDLIQSDQYTQDVGGTCMNLTVPNRTLREFNYTAIVRNTDPDVASYTLSTVETRNPTTGVISTSYSLRSGGKITRGMIDLNNPIRWEDVSAAGKNETLHQAVTVATGHILHYKSEFRADGYSLGNLLYSLPLAPGQKKDIVIIDSSHSFRGTESQALSQREQLAADLLSERDIVDQIGGNIGEQLSGDSESSTWGVSAAAGASGGGLGWGANVGVAGGYSKAASSANQQSGRNLSGFFSERLRQGIHQNSTSYRQQNSTIVTTANEAQRYMAETTAIANHNHCHAITIMHYEVLRHFAVFQTLVDVEECVFIPFPLTKFSMENVAKWADVLVTRLLPLNANTYLNSTRFYSSGRRHPLAPAFDAVERVRTNWALVKWPDGPYDQDPIIWGKGEFTMSVNIPRPNTRYDMIKSLPIIKTHTNDDDAKSFFLGVITGGLSFLASGSSGSETQARKDISDKFMRLDANYQNRRPADCIRIINLDPVSANNANGFDPVQFFADSPRDRDLWEIYSYLLGNGRTPDGVRKTLKLYFLEATISEWDDIWREKMVPEIYDRMFKTIRFKGIGFDITKLGGYRGGPQMTRGAFSGTVGLTRKEVNFLTITCSESAVMKDLAKYDVEFTIRWFSATYSTAYYNGLLYNGGVNNDLFDDVKIYCPETAEEQRDPKTDDRWLTQRLITHLNRNIEYYNRVLLYSLDAQRRYMLLDGFHIEVFERDGTPIGSHSLSSVLKNSPVGMAGNSMIFPVSPGYKVDRSLILKAKEGEEPPSLLDQYKPEIPTPPYRISVPSKGVYSESMMGQCNACEKLQPDTSQDWTKFTTEQTTPINAITAPTPTVTNYQPQTKDFAPPMISIQNAPAAPDPGVGLSGVTELLGKSGVFRDVTGLEGTQKNAIQTYIANSESARAVAGMAGTAATQAHNTSNSAQIMGTIQQGVDAGYFTKAEAGQLIKQHVQSQIDGGQTQKSTLEQQKATLKPTLSDAAVTAAANNKTVEATTVDSEGKVSSIKITPGTSSAVTQAKVEPPVPIIKQPTPNTCWAAVTTMLASWKAGKTLAPEEALSKAGEQYVTMFKNDVGLQQNQKDQFLTAMGFVSEPPASYPPSQFVTWMKTFGPLWITTDSNTLSGFSPHAKVLIQIDGDGNDDGSNTTFTWINPSKGQTVNQSFKDFVTSYEQMVTDNPGALFTQIVHFADKVIAAPPGEGFDVEGPWDAHWPVHENLTLSGLVSAGIAPRGTTYENAPAAIREFLRGVLWNDDPGNLFFDDREDNNWNFSSGAAWLTAFGYGKLNDKLSDKVDTNITSRSHFWDLQFFHAMASELGEDPHHTLAKILLWFEVMYKFSVGQDVFDSGTIENVTISTQANTKTYTLTDFFTTTTAPKRTETMFALLTKNTKYKNVDIKRRALGSCMHILQDSFAKGHTRRTILNKPEFDAGAAPKLGAVENFHTYSGQKKDHGHWDTWQKDWKPMDPSNPDSFNALYGARSARDAAEKLATFWGASTHWEAGVKAWLEGEVFQLSPSVTPADNTV